MTHVSSRLERRIRRVRFDNWRNNSTKRHSRAQLPIHLLSNSFHTTTTTEDWAEGRQVRGSLVELKQQAQCCCLPLYLNEMLHT
jgi:hypothetical protein